MSDSKLFNILSDGSLADILRPGIEPVWYVDKFD
jgi:hypothetical protein